MEGQIITVTDQIAEAQKEILPEEIKAAKELVATTTTERTKQKFRQTQLRIEEIDRKIKNLLEEKERLLQKNQKRAIHLNPTQEK